MLDLEVNEVPEGLESHYVAKDDGKFVLDVKGMVPTTKLESLQDELNATKEKVSEFRTNNRKLYSDLEAKKAATGDESVQLDELKGQFDNIKTQLETENLALKSQLEEVILSDQVRKLASDMGVYDSAVDDVLNRSKKMFAVADGKVVPQKKSYVDKDGNSLTMETWVRDLSENAPHLFLSSSGANARQSVKGKAQVVLTGTQKIAAGLNKL